MPQVDCGNSDVVALDLVVRLVVLRCRCDLTRVVSRNLIRSEMDAMLGFAAESTRRADEAVWRGSSTVLPLLVVQARLAKGVKLA